jgi:sensor histidine kinase YesM
MVADTGVGGTPTDFAHGRHPRADAEPDRGAGIGLTNIERRLDRYYGEAASCMVRSTPGVGTTVEIRVPVVRAALPVAS